MGRSEGVAVGLFVGLSVTGFLVGFRVTGFLVGLAVIGVDVCFDVDVCGRGVVGLGVESCVWDG